MPECKACQIKNNIEITAVVIYKETPIKITGRKWAVKEIRDFLSVHTVDFEKVVEFYKQAGKRKSEYDKQA